MDTLELSLLLEESLVCGQVAAAAATPPPAITVLVGGRVGPSDRLTWYPLGSSDVFWWAAAWAPVTATPGRRRRYARATLLQVKCKTHTPFAYQAHPC